MGTKHIRVLQKIRRSSRLQSFAAKMGVERLQLLVRFCNLIGLFPFRMILNEQTNQFHRFDRHWRHPSNWWFVFIFMAQTFLTLQVVYMVVLPHSNSNNEPNKTNFVYQMIFFAFILTHMILSWCPRIILFRLRLLESAVENLHRIDRTLSKISLIKPCDTTRRRTLVGISITFLLVKFIFDIIYKYHKLE